VASLSQGRTAAAQCGLFTYKSVPVIFEPPCSSNYIKLNVNKTRVISCCGKQPGVVLLRKCVYLL